MILIKCLRCLVQSNNLARVADIVVTRRVSEGCQTISLANASGYYAEATLNECGDKALTRETL